MPDEYELLMRRALELAARGRGLVEPNPMVGAVVLDRSGVVVAEGWHQRFGGPHAEVIAFEAAGESAREGTLVVTLEPCCHHGKTPPCSDLVVRTGVARVIVAMTDPFPKVAGGGLEALRAGGLDVRVGICEREAQQLNAPYLKLVRTGRPWVHAKWAMTLDGKLATKTGDSKWISGEESRRRVHELRGRMDAIIVGRGTVVADDPLLTARPPGARVAARVVMTASGELPGACQLLRTARDVPVIIYTSPGKESLLADWRAAGAQVVPVAGLGAALDYLGNQRFTNVLVEGGAGLLGSCLDAGVLDEFHVFVAPKIAGGGGPSPIAGGGIEKMAEAFCLVEFGCELSGNDVYLHGYAGDALGRISGRVG